MASEFPTRVLSMRPAVPKSPRSYLIAILYHSQSAPSVCHSGKAGTRSTVIFGDPRMISHGKNHLGFIDQGLGAADVSKSYQQPLASRYTQETYCRVFR